MIRRLARLILRRELGALRARVHALEAKVVSVTDMAAHFKAEVDAFHAMHSRVVDERDALQKRAPRPDPTPAEARMLEIVRANPGMDGPSLGVRAWAPDEGWHSSLEQPELTKLHAAHLTALYRKSLVRREKAGNTYRYWSVE